MPPAQPEQPPPEDVAVRAPVWPAPVRVRQADMSFFVSPEAHLGQAGVVVAELETISSNCAPHLLQQYSYMGMAKAPWVMAGLGPEASSYRSSR